MDSCLLLLSSAELKVISIRVCCSDKSKRSYDDDYDLDDLFNSDDWPDDDDIEE